MAFEFLVQQGYPKLVFPERVGAQTDQRIVESRNAGPASYATGGHPLTVAGGELTEMRLSTVESFNCQWQSPGAAAAILSYDPATEMVQAWTDFPGGTEVGAAVDLSALIFNLELRGVQSDDG